MVAVVNNTTRSLYIDGVLRQSDTGNGIQAVTGHTGPTYIGNAGDLQRV